jgi:hypothetical protein
MRMGATKPYVVQRPSKRYARFVVFCAMLLKLAVALLKTTATTLATGRRTSLLPMT